MSDRDGTPSIEQIQDRIRELAYLMWEAAGRQQGLAAEYWFAAEREVMTTVKAAMAMMTPEEPSPAPAAKPAEVVKAPPAPKVVVEAPAKAPEAVAKPAPAKAAEPTAKPAPAKAPTATPAPTPAPAATPAPVTAPVAAPTPAVSTIAAAKIPVEAIEGIGPAFAAKLKAAGIETTEQLLDKCGSKAGRVAVSQAASITQKNLLRWANMADLMRVSTSGGIDPQAAELLEASGVDTVKELKTRDAMNLAAKMTEVNARKKLTTTVPGVEQLKAWIAEASKLAPKITH